MCFCHFKVPAGAEACLSGEVAVLSSVHLQTDALGILGCLSPRTFRWVCSLDRAAGFMP